MSKIYCHLYYEESIKDPKFANRRRNRWQGRWLRKSEYYQKNKEKIFESQRNYRKKNKEKVNKRNKKWRDANKDKVALMLKKSRKKYWERNRKKFAEYQRKYYAKNKKQISEKLIKSRLVKNKDSMIYLPWSHPYYRESVSDPKFLYCMRSEESKEKSKGKAKKYREMNRKEEIERKKKWYQESKERLVEKDKIHKEEITDIYIKSLLCNNKGIPRKFIPQELIKAKRKEIKYKRAIKKVNDNLKKKEDYLNNLIERRLNISNTNEKVVAK